MTSSNLYTTYMQYHVFILPLLGFLWGMVLMQLLRLEREVRTFKRVARYPDFYQSYNAFVDCGKRRINEAVVQKIVVYRVAKPIYAFPPVVLGL